MTPEFWLGFYYGVLAGAIPCLLFSLYVLNRRVQQWLSQYSPDPARAIRSASKKGQSNG